MLLIIFSLYKMTKTKKRKAPSDHAKEFSLGYQKEGNDGNMWEIVENKNGVKRWKKISSGKSKTLKSFKSKQNKTRKKRKSKKQGILGFIGNIFGKKSKKQEKSNDDDDDDSNKLNKNNEKYKEIKKKMKGYKSYMTHYNGGRPYLVYIKNDDVHIYKYPKCSNFNDIINMEDYSNNDNENKWMYIDFVKNYKAKKVFVGFDSCKFDGSDAVNLGKKWTMGNTILLQISKNKYVIIDATIQEFTTKDEIIRFFAQIGPNDVPYPIALSKDNVYFTLEMIYIPRVLFPKMKEAEFENVYSMFYGNKDEEYDNISKILNKNIKGLKKKHIDSAY